MRVPGFDDAPNGPKLKQLALFLARVGLTLRVIPPRCHGVEHVLVWPEEMSIGMESTVRSRFSRGWAKKYKREAEVR